MEDFHEIDAYHAPDRRSLIHRSNAKENSLQEPLQSVLPVDGHGDYLQTNNHTCIMRASSHEKYFMDEKTDMETNRLVRRNTSVMPVKDVMVGELPFVSGAKVLSGSGPDMAHHQRPCQITRMVSASPDRARARELHNDQSCKAATSVNMQASDDTPFLLHLRFPTLSGRPTQSYGLTFIQASGNDTRHPKIAPTNHSQIKGNDGRAELALGLTGDSDRSLLSPLMPWVSEDDDKSLIDEDIMEACPLLTNSKWSENSTNDEHESKIGLDELPPDTELEEFIAFHMSRKAHR
jgi:hypothetical protein